MVDSRAMTFNTARAKGFLSDYNYELPEDPWVGELIGKCWGKSNNLICFFKDIETEINYQVSVFRSEGGAYCPKYGNIDFSEPGMEGRIFLIETEATSKGKKIWVHGSEILENDN